MRLLIIIALLLWRIFLEIPHGWADEKLKEREKQFLLVADMCTEFRKKQRLTQHQLDELLFENFVTPLAMSKGGTGVIRQNISVDLTSKHNSLTIGGKEWQGKPLHQTEIVLSDGKSVIDQTGFDSDSLILILFSPEHISFIDYKRKQTGRYLREPVE